MAKGKPKQMLIVRRATGPRKSRARVGARVPLLFVFVALIAAGMGECVEHRLIGAQPSSQSEKSGR
jgi:hypothetical protein